MDNITQPSTTRKSRIIANSDVWLEGEATRQLENIASDPDCAVAVGMPDLHPGPGVPIGAAVGFSSTIRPKLVGSDAGCGALVVALGKVKFSTATIRRTESEFDTVPLDGVDTDALYRRVWNRGPMGLVGLGLPDAIEALAEYIGNDQDSDSGALPFPNFGTALGTIGGGNHFAEIGRVSSVFDQGSAERLGLRKGELVLLCHSGSRGLGKMIADTWNDKILEQNNAADYLADLAGAIRFAQANRILLAWRLLKALRAVRRSKIIFAFDVVHNFVNHEEVGSRWLWVHRKGCAPACDGQTTVVLGSRGAPSWIMRGRGNPTGLSSVAHGAGRKMQRSEARQKIRARYRRKQLTKSANGGIVICRDPKLLYEEHPDAYKPIEPIIDSLEQAQLADRVASIEPLLSVKK